VSTLETPLEKSGTVKAGKTEADVVAWMIAPESGWNFTDDPNNAITYCSGAAADAHAIGHPVQSRFWAGVGVALVAAADNPHIQVGAVLGDLAGLPVPR